MKNRGLSPDASGRRSRRRGTARLFVLGAAFAASGLAATPAIVGAAPPAEQRTAAERAIRFDIAAGSIEAAIADFQRLTGVAVTLADPGLGRIQSPGVSGVFTPDEALDRLLAGTSVRASRTAQGVTLDVRGVEEFVAVSAAPPRPSSPKYTEPLRDTPQTIVVIPETVVQQQGATSLRDALRNTPGITLTAGEGGTAPGDNLLIRGFSARNDVYIDGARDPGVVSRDTFNTEAIEVAKGPSSVTAGRGSTGGSINLVTKSASLANAIGARVTGGNAAYKRSTIDVNRRIGESAAIRLNGMWQDAGVAGRDDVTQKGWGVAPTIGLGLGKPTTVTFGYQHLHQHNVPDYGLPGTLPDLAVAAGKTVDDLDFSNFYGLLARDHEKMDSDIATATVEHRFTPSRSLRNLTRYGRNNLDRVVTPPRAASAANAAADPGFDPAIAQIRRTDTKYQYRDDRTLTNQSDLTMRFGSGAIQHDAVVGLELSRDRQPSFAASDTFASGRPPVTDLFNPDPMQAYQPSIAPTGARSEARSHSAALYAFDTLKLTPQWQVDLGGRFDRVDVDYQTVSAAGVPAAFGRTDQAFSGRAGLVFKPVSRGSLYALYSTAFNPSYDGSFGLTLAASGANDAALPPERSFNVEGGAKWNLRSDLFATAAVFRTEKTNAKTTDASGATILAGDQQVAGVELGLSGHLTSRWGVFAGLSLMHGTVKESANPAEAGQRLSYVPRASFNLWTTYRLPRHVTIGGGAQYTDGYFFNNTNALTTANSAAIQQLTEYWLFNMLGIYQVNPHLSLQVNGINLANARYVDRGYTGHFVPGPGRALLAGPVLNF
jgi:catecholate siderophore receptor